MSLKQEEENVLLGQDFEVEAQVEPRGNKLGSRFGRRPVVLAMGIFGVVAVLAVVAMNGSSVKPATGDTSKLVQFDEIISTLPMQNGTTAGPPPGEHHTVEDICTSEWTTVTSADNDTKVAVNKSFMLVSALRQSCELAVAPFAFDPTSFVKGEGHKHYMHAHVKSSSDCLSRTYKLAFYIGDEDETKATSFILQVNYDKVSQAWQLLGSEPTECAIQVGTAAAPQAIELSSAPVKEAAKFAIDELGYQMKKMNCSQGNLSIAMIRGAIAAVQAGLVLQMLIDVNIAGEIKTVMLAVYERCGGAGECFRQLMLKDPPCEVFLDSALAARRLFGANGMGAEPEDPTENIVALKKHMRNHRRLGSSGRSPIQPRHITSGIMAASHDPRESECFRRITVYNQGSCGSCYAQAIGQMMGLRKCLAGTNGAARLLKDLPRVKQEAPKELAKETSVEIAKERRLETPRVTKKGCECYKEWTATKKCTDYCCNNDNSPGEWCFVKDSLCEGVNWGYCKPEDTPQPACDDSAQWAAAEGPNCAWFATNDLGCTKYKDYGQMTHCKKTCNKCPTAVNQNSDANPWSNALYENMPAVADIAKCAKSSDNSQQGCNGGNIQGVWNNYLQETGRSLWRMGAQCMPYDMKCEASTGVVNPLSDGACSAYTGYEMWHKPCSCIPDSVKAAAFTCPATSPSTGCDFAVPNAFFSVSGVSQGLSNADAVLNFQRHIAEYGPIYVSFSTTNEFMSWDWTGKPVYTGGGSPEGGHAVIAVGWGSEGGDYWLLRNSWGADWADKGYCRFGRGRNLDGIEGQAGASMATSDFADFSPPYCSLDSWSWSYYNDCSSMKLTLSITCSKASTLKIFTSQILTDRKQVETGVSGRSITAVANTANVQFQPEAFEISSKASGGLGFCTASGDMWLSMEADDGKGNTAKTSHFINIPAIM